MQLLKEVLAGLLVAVPCLLAAAFLSGPGLERRVLFAVSLVLIGCLCFNRLTDDNRVDF